MFLWLNGKGVSGRKIRINKTSIVIYCWTHNKNKMLKKYKLVSMPFTFFVDQTHLTFGRQLTFGRHGIDLPVASVRSII